MQLRQLPIVLCLTLLMTSTATALSADDTTRSVIVSTFIDASGLFIDTDQEGSQRVGPGSFLEAAVDGTGLADIVNATGEATQDTSVEIDRFGRLRVGGGGGGGAGSVFDVNDPGFPSRAVSSADSRLTILFTLDVARPFVVSTSLSAELSEANLFEPSGSILTDVRAFARLDGLASSVVFAREVEDATAGDGARLDDFTLEGILAPDTYVLELLALSNLRGFEDATGFSVAGFGIDLTVIPEPGSALTIGLGLMALALRRERSQSASS